MHTSLRRRVFLRRLRQRSFASISAGLCLLLVGPGMGQVDLPPDVLVQSEALPENLPSPAEIIGRHIEVTGGVDAHLMIRNRVMTGSVEGPNSDGRMRLVIHSAAPNSQHLDAAGQAYVRNADEAWTYDGEIVVASSGAQRRQEIRRARFHALIDWETTYPLARTVGEELIDDRAAFVVRLATEECDQVELWFDKETGRHVRTIEDIAYAGDTLRSDTVIEAYKDVDGIAVPVVTRRVLIYQGRRIEQVYEWTNVRHNIEIPEGLFDTPFELQDDEIAE